MMARACVFRDIEVWMRMDPRRGAGDVAQIRSKLHRSRERDGQGIRVYTSAHTYITSGATPAAQHARP